MTKIIFLGTSSAQPTDSRFSTCVCIELDGEILIFDAGEGAQISFSKTHLDWKKKTKFFVTHLHSDHCIGILGIIQTMILKNRESMIEIYGPIGIKKFINFNLDMLNFKPMFPIKINEIKKTGQILETDGYSIYSCNANHTIPAFSYLFEEKNSLNQTNIQKIGISGDTRPSSQLTKFFKHCNYLIFDSTFTSTNQQLARQKHHSTASEAAKLAKNANVSHLILTHIPPIHQTGQRLLKEAKKIHNSVILAKDRLIIKIN